MKLLELLYVLSISLQVGGTEALILNYWMIPSVSKMAQQELEKNLILVKLKKITMIIKRKLK